jgi:NAD(P)H-hydrate epimerase
MGKHPLKVATSKWMSIIETNSAVYGVTTNKLMEAAGKAVADFVFQHQPKKVVVVTGSGGKAGDGYVAARHLASLGVNVSVRWVTNPELNSHEEARRNWESLKTLTTIEAGPLTGKQIAADVIIDAMLGTGFSGKPRKEFVEAIRLVNESGAKVISIDLPSGLICDVEESLSPSVEADAVVTMHRPKPCLLKLHCDTKIASIGIPPEAEIFAGPGDIVQNIPSRTRVSKKGDAGKVLIVAGSDEYTGAAILCAMGAFRAGADLVYLVSSPKTVEAARSFIPELICFEYPHTHLDDRGVTIASRLAEKVGALAIGPGLGFHTGSADQTPALATKTASLLRAAKRNSVPTVIDADAIKAIPELPSAGKGLLSGSIVTPHAGEFEYLTNQKTPVALGARIHGAMAVAKALDICVLLKGYCDIIASPTAVRLSSSGVPAMAVAGTGDVLTGVTATFVAKGVSAFSAALTAAYAVGLAGTLASIKCGEHLMARDIVDFLPQALTNPVNVSKTAGPTKLPEQVLGDVNWRELQNML